MGDEYEYCNCEQARTLRRALIGIQLLLQNGTVIGCKGLADRALAKDERAYDLYLWDERNEVLDVKAK